MRLFFRELTASDAVICVNNALGEFGVLKGPEAEKTWLEFFVISAVDIVLAVTDNNKVRVLTVDVDSGDHSALGQIEDKSEQVIKGGSAITWCLIILLFLFFFLLLLLTASNAHNAALFLVLVIVIVVVIFLLEVHGRVVLIRNLLVMTLGLSEESFDNLDRR